MSFLDVREISLFILLVDMSREINITISFVEWGDKGCLRVFGHFYRAFHGCNPSRLQTKSVFCCLFLGF